MKRLLLAVLFLLASCGESTDVRVSGADSRYLTPQERVSLARYDYGRAASRQIDFDGFQKVALKAVASSSFSGTITTPYYTAATSDCSAPAYSFTGDTDTGLTSTAANTLVGCVGGVAKWTLNPTAGAGATIAAGTAASTVHGLSITQTTAAGGEGANALNILPTWNSNASASTAILLNVTNTSSHASSLLMDLQVGGVSAFKIGKAGTTTFTGNIVMGASTGVTNAVSTTGTQFNVYGQYVSVGSAGIYGFTASTQDAALDTGISRGAAGVVAIGTGAAGSTAGTVRAQVVGTPTGYAIASLPTAVAGDRTFVTDQITACAAIGVAPTAGGALKCPVFYNGTAWVGG